MNRESANAEHNHGREATHGSRSAGRQYKNGVDKSHIEQSSGLKMQIGAEKVLEPSTLKETRPKVEIHGRMRSARGRRVPRASGDVHCCTLWPYWGTRADARCKP